MVTGQDMTSTAAACFWQCCDGMLPLPLLLLLQHR